VGLGLNKILFDGMLFKILKKMVCPSERDKKEENIQGPLGISLSHSHTD